jgi:transposase
MSNVELAVLCPRLAGVHVGAVVAEGAWLRVRATAEAANAPCPGCGTASQRVHSRYARVLHDPAVGGRITTIELTVRRFFCDAPGCRRKTFVEQIAGLTLRHARHSVAARTLLQAVALALGGRAGARLTGRLAMPTGRMSLLRLIRAMPEPTVSTPTVLGVDDFALRRGHVYATILLDMNTHRPVDVLPDRTAETLTAWLVAHPGVEVICRDRSGAYAEGARSGAPDAIQVADRWHLWHNLAEAVEKTVIRHRADLPEPQPDTVDEPEPDEPSTAAATQPADSRLMVRTRERYAAVQDLLASGQSLSRICRTLNLDRKTVQRFARADTVDQLLTKARNRGSLLDAFKPHLHERFNHGCTDAARLTEEIKAMGYRGSDKTVRRYLHPFRATLTAPAATPAPPTVRKVTGWLTRRPDDLTENQTLRLKNILQRSPALTATYEHVRGFADMLTQRHGHALGTWMQQVDTHGTPDLRSFANGLKSDLDAVTAGLTLPWSSGPVEGHVNRIKMLKRQMFGRANLDLLRKRVLLTT